MSAKPEKQYFRDNFSVLQKLLLCHYFAMRQYRYRTIWRIWKNVTLNSTHPEKRIKTECRKFSYLSMYSHMHEDRPAAGKGCPAFPTLERGAAPLCHPLYELLHILLFSRHFPAFPGPPAPPLYGRWSFTVVACCLLLLQFVVIAHSMCRRKVSVECLLKTGQLK
jgi:hypothetical protein